MRARNLFFRLLDRQTQEGDRLRESLIWKLHFSNVGLCERRDKKIEIYCPVQILPTGKQLGFALGGQGVASFSRRRARWSLSVRGCKRLLVAFPRIIGSRI